ncbi:MAG: CHC2 zinc finger domain-containing protein [Peptostreptococcaceae bacterium]|jgi:hypothetical protein|nr:CHC2 zinc finger domain-containing protein [Peptostreptococcaceae bacterium]
MYDLKEIKSISCVDVAKKYGIDLNEKHGRLWGKLREGERTASFSINIEKNFWYDFGAAKGGSVIDLVVELEGISPKDAINQLAEEYGFKKEKSSGWRPLTNSQYKELGIQPERATMNFKFDLDKHTEEQLERWSKKYGMPVKDLAAKYPKVYNQMVTKIGMENINTLRDAYYSRLKMCQDPSLSKLDKQFLKTMAKDDAVEINRKIDLLQKAVTSVKTNFKHLLVNHEKDFKVIKNQKQPKELTEDEKIRERIVKVYKKLYNFNQIEYFNVEQAKALYDINRSVTKDNNKFLSIQCIKEGYKNLGNMIEKFECDCNKALQQGDQVQISRLVKDMNKIQNAFRTFNVVMEGIKGANLAHKNEIAKQNVEKVQEQDISIDLQT